VRKLKRILYIVIVVKKNLIKPGKTQEGRLIKCSSKRKEVRAMLAVITYNEGSPDPEYFEVEQANLQSVLSVIKKKKPKFLTEEIKTVEFFENENFLNSTIRGNYLAISNIAELLYEGGNEDLLHECCITALEPLMKRAEELAGILRHYVNHKDIEEEVNHEQGKRDRKTA
jgi:hypothetical protein